MTSDIDIWRGGSA